MNERDLHNLVNKDPWLKYHFNGIFGCDDVPAINDSYHFVIVNTRRRKKEQQEEEEEQEPAHWVCFFKSAPRELDCFDSLGSGERVKEILAQNYRLIKDIDLPRFSLEQYQASDSVTCGQFCLYFASERLLHLYDSFTEVLSNIFSTDTKENERRVADFVTRTEHHFQVKQEAVKKAGL